MDSIEPQPALDPEPAPETPRKPARRAGFAVFVAAGILLSRIAGLVRERVFAHYLGNSDAAGAFKAALRIPNFLQNLFGEGVLSASFIPVYARLLAEKDEETAGRVAGVVATLLALSVSLIVALGVLATPAIIGLVAPGFQGDVRALTVRIVRILFPGVGLLVLSAWCLGVLNSHHKFFLSYVAPVFWNIAMIATLVMFGGRLAQYPLAVALAWGTVVGSALQFGMQVPFVFRYASEIRFGIDTALAPVRDVFRNLGPVVLSRGVVQLSAYIDGMIASFLGANAVSSLGYAQTIYLLPIGLFGMSVAAAELPQMSQATGTPEEIFAALRTRLDRGLRQIAFFVIPSVVAFVVLGRRLVAALYQTGRFGDDDTRYVWYILVGSAVGLLAATLGRLYSSAFYALRDTRTPLRFAIIRVVLTGALGYLFAFPLRPAMVAGLEAAGVPLPQIAGGTLGLGAIGLTASAGVAGWVEFWLLRRALGSKIGLVHLALGFQLRLWASAIVAAVAALGAGHVYLRLAAGERLLLHPISAAVVILGVYGVAYFLAAFLAGVPEAKRTIGRLL
ncbi:MAG TPA: murein biosynthesis integral membrane protein MurJ [Vicinamibacteria bacterium]|nr:murein biosynthesis integral membrane protein MurJ [Vicinamibacteria bacterium]